jgi:transcription antitermination factor NusG
MSTPYITSRDCASADLPKEWFAAQVWLGKERVSANHLASRGYEVFLPSYLEYRRWSDRVKTSERPLFPGYLFCRVQAHTSGRIVTAPFVIRIVGDGGGPSAIPLHQIEALQRTTEARLSAEPWEFLQVGQRVRVCAGPLTGVEGIVLRAHNRHRLIISVQLLQRSVAVEIQPTWATLSC